VLVIRNRNRDRNRNRGSRLEACSRNADFGLRISDFGYRTSDIEPGTSALGLLFREPKIWIPSPSPESQVISSLEPTTVGDR